MPVRRDLGSVDAPEAHDEWGPLDAGIASHRRKIAALYDRCPLQIAEMHNFGRCGAVFFLFQLSSARKIGPELAKRYSFSCAAGNISQFCVADRAPSSPWTALIHWKHGEKLMHHNPEIH